MSRAFWGYAVTAAGWVIGAYTGQWWVFSAGLQSSAEDEGFRERVAARRARAALVAPVETAE